MNRSKARELKVFSANAVMPLSVTSSAFAAADPSNARAASAAAVSLLTMSSLPARSTVGLVTRQATGFALAPCGILRSTACCDRPNYGDAGLESIRRKIVVRSADAQVDALHVGVVEEVACCAREHAAAHLQHVG